MDTTIEKWQNPNNCNRLQCKIPTAHSLIPPAHFVSRSKNTLF